MSRLLLAGMGALVVLVSACAGTSPSGTTGPSRGPSASPAAAASPSPTRPATSPVATIAAEPPSLDIELVSNGLDRPISITSDATGRLYVNEQVGRVSTLEPDGSLHVMLDITDRVGSASSEQGLLGMALHPDWPQTGRAFVHYTDLAGDTVLSQFGSAQATQLPATLTADTERMLLQVDQPYANHNGGQLSFGPDGYLYLGLGDGGSQGDPHGHGQDAGTLLASILRLDVSSGDGYSIPADNPFVGGGGAPEVWIYGARNPWRFSFDRLTGDLWIGDVGASSWEEIDRLAPNAAAGVNLGWNIMEGAHCRAIEPCPQEGLALPLAEYGHDLGISVTGGFVYRGSALAGLWGWYLFADYGSGLLFGIPSDAVAPAGAALSPRILLATGLTVSAFGEDADGELYVADHGGGGIYRIVAGG